MRAPTALIGTDMLAREIARGDIRIYDCTTYLEPKPSLLSCGSDRTEMTRGCC
jgi:hypothetical protein